MRVTIVRFDGPGLIVKPRWRTPFTIAYGEILTVERQRSPRKLGLHTRTNARLWIATGDRSAVENELRRRGVRIVDLWGAIIAPTLADFEGELSREPIRMRQSSDSA